MNTRTLILAGALGGAIVAAFLYQRPTEKPLTLEQAIAGLEATDDLDRAHASLVLSNMEPPPAAAVDALVKALGDEDYAVRLNVSKALKRIGAPAVPGLIKTMEAKGRAAYVAAETLGSMGEVAAPAIPALGAATRGGKDAPIHAATEALKRFGDRGMAELLKTYREGTGAEHWTADRISDALATFGAKVVPLVIDDLDGTPTDRSNNALVLLGKIGEPAAPALLEVLKTGAPRRQDIAIGVLRNGKVRTPAAIAAVTALAKSPDERVRDSAARYLAELGEK